MSGQIWKNISAVLLFLILLIYEQIPAVTAQGLNPDSPDPTETVILTESFDFAVRKDSKDSLFQEETPTPEKSDEIDLEQTPTITQTSTLAEVKNIPPDIKIIQPSDDLYLTQGEMFTIQWEDEDPDDNAIINIAIDTDQDISNQIGETWIIRGLTEDEDINSLDSFVVDTSTFQPGEYYIIGEIFDANNKQVSIAGGKLIL